MSNFQNPQNPQPNPLPHDGIAHLPMNVAILGTPTDVIMKFEYAAGTFVSVMNKESAKVIAQQLNAAAIGIAIAGNGNTP